MAKLAALHAFCQELKARLPKCTDKPSIEALSSVLGEQIRRATVIAGALFHKSVDFNQDTCADLDRVATDAWNLATKLRRDTSASILNRSFLLLQTRVFCFFLIDISRRACYATNSNIPVKDLLHLLELSLKAGKTSLDEQELDLALICLQRSADVLQQLHDLKPSSNYRPEFGRLEAEYFVLRTFLVSSRANTRYGSGPPDLRSPGNKTMSTSRNICSTNRAASSRTLTDARPSR